MPETTQYVPGDVLVFTRDSGGVCQIRAGDTARYLGDDYVRVLDGPSRDWLLHLGEGAPVALAALANIGPGAGR